MTVTQHSRLTLVNVKDLQAFHTFIRLAAGRIGQEFNASALSVEVGVSLPTVKNWLSVLAASYVVYLLHPYHANIGKRLTKTPKLYFTTLVLPLFFLALTASSSWTCILCAEVSWRIWW